MTKYYYYKIENLINNKVYIGITINPEERRRRHFSELRRNTHHSHKLQNAFNKYKENNFIFIILNVKEFETRDEAHLYERELINKYNSFLNGYNETHGGDEVASIEAHEKTKKANQNKVDDIVQIDVETWDIVNIYPSLREAERLTGYKRVNIKDCCSRGSISCNGYYWAYSKNYFDNNWIPKLSEKNIPIARIEDNKIIEVYESAAEAGKKLGIDRSNIRASILRNGTCNGYTFIRISHKEYYDYYGYKQPVETRDLTVS